VADLDPRDLTVWRALCEHLDGKRYKAEYPGPRHYGPRTFLSAPPEQWPAFARLIALDKEAVAARRDFALIWWSGGYGWRLRRGWRERLAELEAAANA
jgi:hypothetical protein